MASYCDDYLDDSSYSSDYLGAATRQSANCVAGIARTLGLAAAGGAAATACGVVAVIGGAWERAVGVCIGWIDYATTY